MAASTQGLQPGRAFKGVASLSTARHHAMLAYGPNASTWWCNHVIGTRRQGAGEWSMSFHVIPFRAHAGDAVGPQRQALRLHLHRQPLILTASGTAQWPRQL